MGDVKGGWRGGLRVTRWRFLAVAGCSGASVAPPRGPPWVPVVPGMTREGGVSPGGSAWWVFGCGPSTPLDTGLRRYDEEAENTGPVPPHRRPALRCGAHGEWARGPSTTDRVDLGVRPNCHPTMGTGFHRYDEEGSRREPIRQRMGASTPCQTTPSPPKDLRSHGRIGFRMKMNSTLQAARMRSRPRPEQ